MNETGSVYLIGGSAGCVLAARPSENADCRVRLFEGTAEARQQIAKSVARRPA